MPELLLTREQIDARTKAPEDDVGLEWDRFSGEVYYYTLETAWLVLQTLSIDCKKSDQLPEFTYKKPIVDEIDSLNVLEVQQSQRIGYYPLAIIKNWYRGPNHWHRDEDDDGEALFCAVEEANGTIGTRYFPMNNISPKVWAIARDIIAKNT